MQEERDLSFEGAFKVLKLLLEGVCEALPPGLGLCRISKHLSPLVKSLQQVLPSLGPSQCIYVIKILEFVSVINSRKEELGEIAEISCFSFEIVRLCLQAEAFGNADTIDKSNAVIQSVFEVSGKNYEIFEEIVQELKSEKVENWHTYDEKVRTI